MPTSVADPAGATPRRLCEPDQLLTVEEIVHQCRLSRATINRLMASGELGSVKIGRARRVPAADLAAYIDRLRLEQAQTPTLASKLVSRTCAEQDLPELVEDEATLARVASVVGHGERRAK